MPQITKHQQQQHQQQQQIIQHTSHKNTIAASNSQLHQQHVQQVRLATSSAQHQYHNSQQQVQSGQQQAHMIQVSEEFVEQTQAQTQSHTTTASNMMISATGEVIQQQQIFKIVSTDTATGNVIIDTSAGNQNINTSTTSKVLLSNLTVLSKQQATAGGVTGQQQSPVATAQTINFVNAKHVYTASTAGNPASAATVCKQQKFSVTATNLGGNFKTTALKQTTNTPQYVQQIAGGIGGQHKMNLTSGNRNTQMITTNARVQAGCGGANTVSHSGALSTTTNTAQTMVLHQPHKFLTTNNVTAKSTLGTGGNVLKKTTGTLRMSNSNNTSAKLMNNLHTTQGVKTFITQTTSSAQLQHQQQPQNVSHPQQLGSLQQHHVKGGSKSKFVKQYTNAIINSAGAVAIATLPHQQHNQNISLNSIHPPHHQQLQTAQSGYVNHHHKTATGIGGSATKVNKINSKYATANVAAQLPPGTQLHQKTTLSQTQTQQYQTPISSSNNSNIKFVNAQGTIIQQQQSQQPQQPLIPQNINIKQQQHHNQYQSIQHFDAIDGGGNGTNLYTTQHHQSVNTAAGNVPATSTNSILSDEIMMVNGTQMTDELSARILQSMSQKSFNNQRYQQQHLVPKSSSCNMLPPPPTTNSAANAVTHLQNASNNHSNILLSPRECILYPPAAAVIGPQQQSSSSHSMLTQPLQSPTKNFNSSSSAAGSLSASISNYMTVSNNNMTTITPHSGLLSSGVSNGTPSPPSSSRQVQSVPNSRSQSMERKLHESSMSRKTTEYYKVNSNNNSLRGSHSNLAPAAQSAYTGVGNITISSSLGSSVPSGLMGMQASSSPLPPRPPSLPSQVAATIDPQPQIANLQASKISPDATNSANDNDDIIGEEIRPLPVGITDIRLQILHAVLLDHTYANPMPSELPTTFAVHLPPLSQPSGSSTAAAAGSSLSTHSQQLHWSLGGIGAVAATVATVANSGTHGVVATSSYAMYSSQLSRLQQDEDSYSAISSSSKLAVGDLDPGEETETAPEAEAEDDSVTRCICDLTHDDGYMICCDKCCAWQHVDCMGIDRQNIPDEYLCELCQPRPVDKARARALQVQKRKEQNQLILAQAAAAGSMAAAGSAGGNGIAGVSGISSVLPSDILAAQQRLSSGVGGFNISGSGHGDASAMQLLGTGGTNLKKGSKILKKIKDSGSGKKSKKTDKLAATGSGLAGKTARKETKKNTKRKKGTHDGSSAAGMTAAEKHAANLRQWIENYELAVTNHYSPELRARLHAITKQPSLLQSILNTENPALKEFSLGNLENRATTVPHAGGKILISNLDIGPNSPICELRGKYMLTTQYKTQNTAMNMNTPPPNNYHVASYKAHKTPGPFIFFYKLQGVEVIAAVNLQGINQTTTTTTLNPDGTFTTTTTTLPAQLSPPPTYLKGPEICVDTRTYGNEARFVRRSCRPNAEIQHLFEKGTIHLFIVALTDIRASTEITIRHEPHDIVAVENRKSNAMVIQPTSTQCACGLSKDCVFGPPLPPAAKLITGRKLLALNGGCGGTSNTGNLTAKQRKVNQQNLNRIRSTSSSGDSNMGGLTAPSTMTPTPTVPVALSLSSPNNLLVGPKIAKNSVINVNNSTTLLPLTASCNSNASNGSSSSCTLANIILDSGICTSSSSPSVSIPSPTQNVHSPIQQILQQQHQQHHLRPVQIMPQQQQHQLMQSLPTPLILTTDTQQQQHHVLIQTPQSAALHPQPQQQQQHLQQQPLGVIAQVAATLSSHIMENDTQKEHLVAPEALFITTQQQQQHPQQELLSPQHHQPLVPPVQISSELESSESATMAAPVPLSINSSQSSNNTTVTSTVVLQQSEEVDMISADIKTEPIIAPSENQALPEPLAVSAPICSHTSPTCGTSPHLQKSPQKINQDTSHQNNQTHSGRKTPAKHLRTTSFSEDNEHRHNNDDSSVATTPNSSSTPKEKPKLSREDRKMEAILRAIEKMERGPQRQKTSKKQNSSSHNTTPTSPNKTFDSADSSTGGTNKRSNSQSIGGTTRTKKKRKAGNRSVANSNQRKRRQSRINSQESIDGCGPHENDTVTSESDGCAAMHSPPIETVAQLNHSTETPISGSAGEGVTNNVDQAAGLLMAFANPAQVGTTEAAMEPPLPPPQILPQYTISSSSPNEVTASPPPTPPSQVSSACLLIEAAVGPLETNLDTSSVDTNNAEFKYPLQAKTKKLLMNNWLHQEEETSATVSESLDESAAASHLLACGVTGGLDSLVQAAMSDFKQSETAEAVDPQPQNLSMVAQRVEEFLQLTECGSPTPPPTKHSYEYEHQQQQIYHMSTPAVDLSVRNHSVPAASPIPPASKNFHLPLQVSTCSNNSSVKKRWLRQAISEESHEESQSFYSPSPSPSTTPVIAVPSFVNAPHLQTAAAPAAAVANHIPNGFTTPLKKRRLLLADKDDMLEENAEQCSADSNVNTPSVPAPHFIPQDSIILEENGKLQDSKLSLMQELQEDIDVDVEKCEVPDTSSEQEQQILPSRADLEQDVSKTSQALKAVVNKVEVVIKHESDNKLINDVKVKEDILLPSSQPHIAPTEFNDQEDDVDILRSPSPGQEMIKAEDNLVKIEPEDTSGNDDVKIDVEREESIAADDVMATQLKQEYKEEIAPPIVAELKVKIVNVKQEHSEEYDLGDNTTKDVRSFSENKSEVITKQEDAEIKTEKKLSDEIQEPNPKRFKTEDNSTSDQKTVIVEGDNVKTEHDAHNVAEEKLIETEECFKSDSLNSELVEEVSASPSLANNNYITTNAARSFLSTDSATPPLPLPSQLIADSCSTAQHLLQRNKTLSDDDIQVRLHNFHKENILFLQSRNKKSKSTNSYSSSTNCISASSGAQQRQNKNISSTGNHQQSYNFEGKDKSEKVSVKHKNSSSSSSSSSASSRKSKLYKRERTTSSSSSSNKNSTSQLSSSPTSNITKNTLVNSSTISLASTSSSTSSVSSSKKLKSLKKSSSSSSTSSSNSISASNMQSTYTASTSEKEKYQRQRTTSGSSSTMTISAATCSSTAHAAFAASKKRQLNFELELTKDLHLVNSVTTNSVKHKRSAEESQSHISLKKSKKESCLIAKEDYKNGTNKVQKTQGVTIHVDKEKKSTHISSSSAKTTLNSEAVAHIALTFPSSGVAYTEDVNTVQPITTPLTTSTPAAPTTVVRDHTNLSHFNNVVVTPSTLIPLESSPPLPNQTTGAFITAQSPSPVQNIPSRVNNTNFMSPTPNQPQLPSTPASGEMSLPVLTSGSNSATHLPFYNTIYGKLLDSHTPSIACATSTPSTSITAATTSALSSSATSPGSLSEYLDTKLKSYNTLGGYVSHTALFGLGNTHGKDSPSLISNDAANEMPAPQVPPVATVSSSLTLSLSSSATPTTPPNISALKILTKTASHDPRLNPQLTAPEPPPQPKRKLSINEYRKRMQQSTSHESIGNSLASTPTTPPTLMEGSTATGIGAVINKCTLNSPEHLAQSVDSQIQKEIMSSSSINAFDSLNSSNSSTSNSSLNESHLKSSSFMEEDSTKGQFNAAPTLLEKQQESLCARLKSLKEKQGLASALGVVGAGNRPRFSSFSESMGSGEFAVRKDDDDLDILNSKRNLSISSSIGGGDLLDNCLEEISSTSTSMSSSREPSPERYTSTSHHHHSKHLVTASATTTVATTSSSICSASQSKAQQHQLNNSDKKTITSVADLERKKNLDIA